MKKGTEIPPAALEAYAARRQRPRQRLRSSQRQPKPLRLHLANLAELLRQEIEVAEKHLELLLTREGSEHG